jgi:hypothetical protein
MGTGSARPAVLDAGALIALDRADPFVVRLIELAGTVHIPAGVLAQAWRDPRRQARLSRVVGAAETTVHPLDAEQARAAGALLGITSTSDVIDATVVLLTRSLGGVAVTSDPDDLRRLDPAIRVAVC